MAETSGEIDLDSVIDRLLEGEFSLGAWFGHPCHSPWVICLRHCTDVTRIVRGNRPGKAVQLAEYEIKYLCTKAREIFISQPILLELEAPIKICGESHLSSSQMTR